MKKQQFLKWVAAVTIAFFVTSCEDSLELDPKVDCDGCNDVPPGGDRIKISPSMLTPNVWEQIADFAGRKIGAVSFTLHKKFAYVGTGYNVTYSSSGSPTLTPSKDFWRYDGNTWTQIADFGGDARVYAAAFGIGNKGYVGTGSGSTHFNDFWQYDRSTNVWTQKADFGGGVRYGATGLAVGLKGYVGTGLSTFAYHKDFWEYDPSTDLWTQKADVGGVARVFAGGFVIGEKRVYLGAGFAQNIGQLDFWEYFPALDIWKERASLANNSNPGHSGFFAIGSKGYAGGNGQLWIYDQSTEAWIQKADFPGIMYSGVGFSLFEQFGYIGVGNYPNGSANSTAFYRYTPD
jgi:N-acetylneuraminic acid mutarotase